MSTSVMPSSSSYVEMEDEDDWELVSREWWHTSYRAVPWAPVEIRHKGVPSKSARRRIAQYHDILHDISSNEGAADSRSRRESIGADTADLNLNLDLDLDLVGVQMVEDILKVYEKVVGFDGGDDAAQLLTLRLEDLAPPRKLFPRPECDEVDVAVLRRRWSEQVESFLGLGGNEKPVLQLSSSQTEEILKHSTFSSLWDLSLPTTTTSPRSPPRSRTPNSMFSSDSETSVNLEPFPRTPKVDPSYPDVRVDEHEEYTKEGHDYGLHSKRLNASATSFVPSTIAPDVPLSPSWPSTSSPSPTSFHQFHFPSISPTMIRPSSLPPTLQKDEQGFYTEVPTPDEKPISDAPRRQSSAPVFPTFLTDKLASPSPRKASKTREIIDQMKSSGSPAAASGPRSRRSRNKSGVDNPEDPKGGVDAAGADGWIRAEGQPSNSDLEVKTRRRKELVAALGGREASKASSGGKTTTSNAAGKTQDKVRDKEQRPSSTLPAKGKEASQKSSPSRSPRKPGSSTSGPHREKSKQREPKSPEDGWITGPAISPNARARSTHHHSRTKSSISVSSGPTTPPSIATFGPSQPFSPVPGPYHPVAAMYPYPAATSPAAAYMQMQMQTQAYFQMQIPAGLGYGAGMGGMAPYQTAYPYAVPTVPGHGQYAEAHLTSKVITGTTGMRHAAW